MARTRITPNPPSSSRNLPPKTRRVISSQNSSSSRNPPRDPNIPSNQAERPAPSQPYHKLVKPRNLFMTTKNFILGPPRLCWVKHPPLLQNSLFFTSREVISPSSHSAKNMTTKSLFTLVSLESPYAPTTKETTVDHFSSSMPPSSRRSNFAFPSPALKGSSSLNWT